MSKFNFSGKVYDIRPAWLRRLFLILVCGWFTFVMFVVLYILGMILMGVYEAYRMFMWWYVDYVKNFWDGEERPEKYKPFDIE